MTANKALDEGVDRGGLEVHRLGEICAELARGGEDPPLAGEMGGHAPGTRSREVASGSGPLLCRLAVLERIEGIEDGLADCGAIGFRHDGDVGEHVASVGPASPALLRIDERHVVVNVVRAVDARDLAVDGHRHDEQPTLEAKAKSMGAPRRAYRK